MKNNNEILDKFISFIEYNLKMAKKHNNKSMMKFLSKKN